jgi:uncharacterized protein YkwD
MSKVITQNRFISEALEAHNHYRKLHNSPPLEHDQVLSDLACEWAEYLAANDKLAYKNAIYKDEAIGENIMRINKFFFGGMKSKVFIYLKTL